jgi:cbb3-type cytochrome oxidase maturation protein
MSVLFVVLPLAVLFSALAVVAFLWSTHDGQLDDLETPPLRALIDDLPAEPQRGERSKV